MSFPPYPTGFNTYENTGYKQFWGSGGFPYVKNDFTGGRVFEYPSDDEMRAQPVMDLQNMNAGCAKCQGGGEEVIGDGKRRKKKKAKKVENFDIEMLEGGRRRKKANKKGKGEDSESDEMEGGAKSGGKKKISVKDVMNYKVKNNVSLKEAWAHFKKN